jgi:hypothetical protein
VDTATTTTTGAASTGTASGATTAETVGTAVAAVPATAGVVDAGPVCSPQHPAVDHAVAHAGRTTAPAPRAPGLVQWDHTVMTPAGSIPAAPAAGDAPTVPGAPGAPAPPTPGSPDAPVAVPAPCSSSTGSGTGRTATTPGGPVAVLTADLPAHRAGTTTARDLAAVAPVVESDDDPGSRPD